mmetsp:Transcript_14846/g.40753  ORF Transcript_14846/g.40753 Transcript_14846/m.40753 type:complete len:220 (-) Transcript_14846:574-1233(-)
MVTFAHMERESAILTGMSCEALASLHRERQYLKRSLGCSTDAAQSNCAKGTMFNARPLNSSSELKAGTLGEVRSTILHTAVSARLAFATNALPQAFAHHARGQLAEASCALGRVTQRVRHAVLGATCIAPARVATSAHRAVELVRTCNVPDPKIGRIAVFAAHVLRSSRRRCRRRRRRHGVRPQRRGDLGHERGDEAVHVRGALDAGDRQALAVRLRVP